MLDAERQQLRYDFGVAPELVGRFVPDEAREDALTMVRQINGVSTYLSQMAVGESRHYEATLYAVGLAQMDAETDIYGNDVSGGVTREVLESVTPVERMEALRLASQAARGDGFDDAVSEVAHWQDESLEQFGGMDENGLWVVTRNKGGCSAVAHLEAMKESPSSDERQLMMDFGQLMQMLDDYLDQPHDESAGISTLFTEGHADGDTVESMIGTVEDGMRRVWGDSPALDRFGKVMRAHHRLAVLENRRPGTARSLLPWYF